MAPTTHLAPTGCPPARPLCPDDTVAVFDALVNHKYLKEPAGRKAKLSDEQAAAVEAGQAEPFGRPLDEVLQLRPKQVRKLMENLTKTERLVRKEDIGNDGSFFYIDYNWFKGVMDFRVGLMKRILKEMDSASKVEWHAAACGRHGQPLTRTDPRDRPPPDPRRKRATSVRGATMSSATRS